MHSRTMPSTLKEFGPLCKPLDSFERIVVLELISKLPYIVPAHSGSWSLKPALRDSLKRNRLPMYSLEGIIDEGWLIPLDYILDPSVESGSSRGHFSVPDLVHVTLTNYGVRLQPIEIKHHGDCKEINGTLRARQLDAHNLFSLYHNSSFLKGCISILSPKSSVRFENGYILTDAEDRFSSRLSSFLGFTYMPKDSHYHIGLEGMRYLESRTSTPFYGIQDGCHIRVEMLCDNPSPNQKARKHPPDYKGLLYDKIAKAKAILHKYGHYPSNISLVQGLADDHEPLVTFRYSSKDLVQLRNITDNSCCAPNTYQEELEARLNSAIIIQRNSLPDNVSIDYSSPSALELYLDLYADKYPLKVTLVKGHVVPISHHGISK